MKHCITVVWFISRVMQVSQFLVSRCIVLNIIKSTKAQSTLEKYVTHTYTQTHLLTHTHTYTPWSPNVPYRIASLATNAMIVCIHVYVA